MTQYIFITDPNPLDTTIRFYYYLPYPEKVHFEILSINGKCIATLEDGWQAAGDHFIVWAADNVADGIYMVRFLAGEESIVQNLSVIRQEHYIQ